MELCINSEGYVLRIYTELSNSPWSNRKKKWILGLMTQNQVNKQKIISALFTLPSLLLWRSELQTKSREVWDEVGKSTVVLQNLPTFSSEASNLSTKDHLSRLQAFSPWSSFSMSTTSHLPKTRTSQIPFSGALLSYGYTSPSLGWPYDPFPVPNSIPFSSTLHHFMGSLVLASAVCHWSLPSAVLLLLNWSPVYHLSTTTNICLYQPWYVVHKRCCKKKKIMKTIYLVHEIHFTTLAGSTFLHSQEF